MQSQHKKMNSTSHTVAWPFTLHVYNVKNIIMYYITDSRDLRNFEQTAPQSKVGATEIILK